MFHEDRDLALFEQVPGLIHDDDFLAVTFTQEYFLLDLVNKLEQYNLTQVLTPLQFIELQYSELVLKLTLFLREKYFP